MKRIAPTLLALSAALAPGMALAHPGHGGSSFTSGLLHPITGADHFAAMLLVGLGAAVFVKRGAWMLPATFLIALAVGFATFAWLPGRFVEAGILVSLVALGLATALRIHAPVPLVIPAIAIFGYVHGAAHGIETPQGALPLVFAAGFMAASAVLHLGGYALARVLPMPALRIIGASSAAIGMAWLGLN
jgi:urease accessory protein